jgi:glyceraldehyde-3-phosphate dehydrogenase (ferredoxin)
MNGAFKKDYEPYQTMGPLCGIFDQRAAENLNHHADMLGFDAISAGGVLAWLMECLDKRYFTPEDLGVDCLPVFSKENFAVETDSMHNSKLGIQLLDSIVEQKGIVDMSHGARRWARKQARVRGRELIDCFLYNSFGRRGWMVPNQYWTPGVLSPMPIMGKYYMHYGPEFLHPRIMGRKNAERFRKELILDNLGICRFHRMWAEDMMPDIVEKLYGLGKEFIKTIEASSYNINSRNSSMLWESWRNVDFLETYLHRRHDVEGDNSPELMGWIDYLKRDRKTAAIDYWYEIHKGISEVLNEF